MLESHKSHWNPTIILPRMLQEPMASVTHRGRRSLRARQRRAATRYVMNTSFRDREKAETVNIVQREQVLSFLHEKYKDEGVCVDAADFVKGEVLTDSRGHGSLQRTR